MAGALKKQKKTRLTLEALLSQVRCRGAEQVWLHGGAIFKGNGPAP